MKMESGDIQNDAAKRPSSSFIPHPSSLFVRYWLPAIVWAAGIFLGSSLTSSQIPSIIHPILFADKVEHGIEYAVLGALLCRAFAGGVGIRLGRAVFLAFLFTTAYGMSDEIHQSFVPGRECELGDVLADSNGGLVGAALVAIFKARRHAGRAE